MWIHALLARYFKVSGDILHVVATEAASLMRTPAWCRQKRSRDVTTGAVDRSFDPALGLMAVTIPEVSFARLAGRIFLPRKSARLL
jgi:hypothetical protein